MYVICMHDSWQKLIWIFFLRVVDQLYMQLTPVISLGGDYAVLVSLLSREEQFHCWPWWYWSAIWWARRSLTCCDQSGHKETQNKWMDQHVADRALKSVYIDSRVLDLLSERLCLYLLFHTEVVRLLSQGSGILFQAFFTASNATFWHTEATRVSSQGSNATYDTEVTRRPWQGSKSNTCYREVPHSSVKVHCSLACLFLTSTLRRTESFINMLFQIFSPTLDLVKEGWEVTSVQG